MTTRLNYAICFVADMDKAIAFYRDKLGIPVKFASPFWSELATGDTTIALHPASDANPAGKIMLGLGVPDVDAFYAEKAGKELEFIEAPREVHGSRIGAFRDSEGGEIRVSG